MYCLNRSLILSIHTDLDYAIVNRLRCLRALINRSTLPLHAFLQWQDSPHTANTQHVMYTPRTAESY